MAQQLAMELKENELVFVENGKLFTDSLRVHEFFGKEHKNVLADIDNIIKKLNTPLYLNGLLDHASTSKNTEFSRLNFQPSDYTNDRGKTYRKYNMTEDGFALVVMGYIDVKAMTAKVRFINEFNRMKEELNKSKLPSSYKEALIALVTQVEENEKLQTQKLMLEQVIAENEPKISYVDKILSAKNAITIKQIAHDYGLTAQKLNKILHNERIQYKQSGQWLLYKDHLNKGYTKSETHNYDDGNGNELARINTKWTQKGRLFIHDILTSMGIKPLIERE